MGKLRKKGGRFISRGAHQAISKLHSSNKHRGSINIINNDHQYISTSSPAPSSSDRPDFSFVVREEIILDRDFDDIYTGRSNWHEGRVVVEQYDVYKNIRICKETCDKRNVQCHLSNPRRGTFWGPWRGCPENRTSWFLGEAYGTGLPQGIEKKNWTKGEYDCLGFTIELTLLLLTVILGVWFC